MFPILVIDDESVTRRLVTFALKPLHIEVLTAEDARSALVIANYHQVALLLVDVNLPDMDGFTLIQELRKIPNTASVPIISFTARNDSDDETRARESGAIGFLYKPFSMQELRDVVTKYAARQ
jgi:two-component system, chemotaxis family, chemotaxis protein CheY